jgi:hypothetical protein
MSNRRENKRRDSSSDEEEPRRPKQGYKVTKSGTAGTATVAKGRNRLRAVLSLVADMSAGNRKTNFMEAVNALTEEYDEVILAYVGKRDALREANSSLDEMRDAAQNLEATEAEVATLRATVTKLLEKRAGCGCASGKANNTAGRCTGACGCAKLDVQCNDKCGCGEFCTRPGDKKSNVNNIVNRRHRGILRGVRRSGAGASAAAAAPREDDYEDEDEDEE